MKFGVTKFHQQHYDRIKNLVDRKQGKVRKVTRDWLQENQLENSEVMS